MRCNSVQFGSTPATQPNWELAIKNFNRTQDYVALALDNADRQKAEAKADKPFVMMPTVLSEYTRATGVPVAYQGRGYLA